MYQMDNTNDLRRYDYGDYTPLTSRCEQIKEYLAGNLCRCSGFVSQTTSILKFLKYKKAQEDA